ncbi:hypothetical protein [Kribbella sp. NBC_00889]|uniref:hypothetical protein n=1 Tax=Kribbella sp. NBC_00889 TaxID=2975974 RepID=UPI0038702237|nr:hypothetical protein OG817_13040 [Kribbella sp. NBC_00889]
MDVTVVEFAAHAAYLEPVTGMGLLVAPRSEIDVVAADDWWPGETWQTTWKDCPAVGLSVHAADHANALEVLADAGWTLLEAGDGAVQLAGHTADGCAAMCLYADRTTYEQLVVEDFQRGFTALRTAAKVRSWR